MSTTPEARPAAVAVTDEMVEAARESLRHKTPLVDVHLNIVRAALEAAAQARAGQDHGGEAAEMIGEVERLKRYVTHLEGARDRYATLYGAAEKRFHTTEARAAKAGEVLRFIEAEASICPWCDAYLDDQVEALSGHKEGCQLATLLSDHPAPEPGVEAGEVKKVENPWLLRGQGDDGPESISYLDPDGWTDDINDATGWPSRMAADGTRAECSLEGIIVEVVWAEDERARRALQTTTDGGRDG